MFCLPLSDASSCVKRDSFLLKACAANDDHTSFMELFRPGIVLVAMVLESAS
jgi:hypothetical protein